MNFNKDFNKSSFPAEKAATDSIAVYTVLTILRKMRKQLSLECMIEYMDVYLLTIENHNGRLKDAVDKALAQASISGIYRKAMNEGLEI